MSAFHALRGSLDGSTELVHSGAWAFRLAWRSHRFFLVGLIVVAIATGLFPAALALVMRGLINAVVAAAAAPAADMSTILPWLAGGLALTIAEVTSKLFGRYASARFEDEVELDLTSRIMEHADRLDIAYFEDPRFQDMIERAQKNTTINFTGLLANTLTFATHALQIASLTAILIVLEPLAIVVLLPIALAHFALQWSISKKHYDEERNRAAKRRWTRYFVSLVTTRDLVAEVKLLDLGPVVIERFRRFMTEFRDRNRTRYLSSFMAGGVFAALTALGVYVIFARVIARVLAGALSVGDVAVFGVAALRLRNALESVVASSTRAMTQALHISNLREFLDVEPHIGTLARPGARAHGASAETESGASGAISRAGSGAISRGAIEIDGVTFHYPGTSEAALSDVTLAIEPGEIVALVGRNGAGKTTLVRLLARFYDPDAGAIRIDGTDLRDFPLPYLRDRIACVFQQPARYEATARENIAYGHWRKLLDEGNGAVEHIARRSGVSALIESLPEKYETQLGRQFGRYDLSGGQWQQLAIARAVARDAAILILDEPAANLDAEAEYELFCRSRRLAEGRTTVLISHRFSTVRMADRIVVLDRGRIVENGTHQQLLASGKTYATLYGYQHRQMAGEGDR